MQQWSLISAVFENLRKVDQNDFQAGGNELLSRNDKKDVET